MQIRSQMGLGIRITPWRPTGNLFPIPLTPWCPRLPKCPRYNSCTIEPNVLDLAVNSRQGEHSRSTDHTTVQLVRDLLVPSTITCQATRRVISASGEPDPTGVRATHFFLSVSCWPLSPLLCRLHDSCSHVGTMHMSCKKNAAGKGHHLGKWLDTVRTIKNEFLFYIRCTICHRKQKWLAAPCKCMVSLQLCYCHCPLRACTCLHAISPEVSLEIRAVHMHTLAKRKLVHPLGDPSSIISWSAAVPFRKTSCIGCVAMLWLFMH